MQMERMSPWSFPPNCSAAKLSISSLAPLILTWAVPTTCVERTSVKKNVFQRAATHRSLILLIIIIMLTEMGTPCAV